MDDGFEEGVVMIVEPDGAQRHQLGDLIREKGFAVMDAEDRSGGRALLEDAAGGVDTVVLQLGEGVDGLEEIRREYPLLPVVVVTESRRVEDAIAALRGGATDYLLQPVSPVELGAAIQSAVSKGQMARELSVRRALDPRSYQPDDGMVSAGETMQKIMQIVDRVKDSSVPVLVTGETGTGKELLARALHRRSKRVGRPFVAINCASLPRELVESELFGHERGAFTGADQSKSGRFSEAHGGTLFLDEVGELDPNVQAKLLRVLQEGEVTPVGGETFKVDARVVVATNRNLEQEVQLGNFRSDLFYRLNVVTIRLPPLRERREEIPTLATHLLDRFLRSENLPSLSLSSEAVQVLLGLDLPGNVRELENILKRSALLASGRVIKAEEIVTDVLGAEPTPDPTDAVDEASDELPLNLANHERELMMRALAQARGNVSAAARSLGIGRTTFYRRAKRYKIAL